MRVSTCKSAECGASIYWRTSTVTQKWICLDAIPTPSDDRFVVAMKFHYVIVSEAQCRPATVEDWANHDQPVYISHWKTCRSPERFSGRRPKEATAA